MTSNGTTEALFGKDSSGNFMKRRGVQTNGASSEKGAGDANTKGTNGTTANSKTRVTIHDIFDKEEVENLGFYLIVRIISVLAWTGSILYATYHVYLACEEHLTIWYKDPVMNPGVLSDVLNRGRDSTDHEWEMFTIVFAKQLWFWYGLFALMSRTVQLAIPNTWKYVATGMSFLMFWKVTGILPTIFLILQPVTYWIIAQTRSKLLAWAATVLIIYHLNSPIIQLFIPDNAAAEYFLVITAAWNCARCISFCYDIWEETEKTRSELGIKYLENGIHYCFYLPLAISGPLVTFESFEKNILLKNIEEFKQRNTAKNFISFLLNMLRLGLNILLIEVILHLLYFRALSMSTQIHRELSLWAICGTIYWLGQFFCCKYKVLYGLPTCVAEFDGMEMPPLPRCPAYLHRYSVLWRDFDRGLYNFLVKYIYLPTLKFIKWADKNNGIPVDIQKLTASYVTFVYVYMWHSLSFDVFVWAALNFLGITIERIGSLIKREMDRRRFMNLRQIDWDFFIEPLVTVPLAAMSILTSSVFCGSLSSATSFASELWRREGNYVMVFLYCFTHTAVTYRTWRHKLSKLAISWYQNQFS